MAAKTSKEVIDYVDQNPGSIGVIGSNWLNDRRDSTNKDESGALADLNELRRHRIVGYTDETSTTGLLEKIRQERRLELCYEFHRWFDLRRYVT